MGPTIFPTLEQLHDDLPVEAQLRVERVLGQRFTPTLGGLTPLPGPVETFARFATGGCALKLPVGGTVVEEGFDRPVVPAFVSIRPGRFVDRLPLAVSEGLIGRSTLHAFGNELVVVDHTLGPRRWVGSRLQTLLAKPLRHYTQLIGIDAAGRWLLRDPAKPGRTLILDRSLPDITPRLPAWTVTSLDQTGWSANDMPMAVRNKQTFVLDENGWRRPKPEETLSTVVPPPAPARSGDGTEYTIDREGIRVTPSQTTTQATTRATTRTFDLQSKSATPTILFAAGRLFVQTEPGKFLRFRPTPAGEQPLVLEAAFDKQIPLESCKRIWLDPTGRIVFATDTSLTITFPDGHVPAGLANAVLIRGDREEE
jgi:hypothetical protein